MKKNKTVGLALGSGGFRGFAHIGVIRSLEKHGIPIDFITGSSIGAWVGAYYSLFKDINKLEEDLTANPRENMLLLFDLSWGGGIVSGQKFSFFLEKNLKEKNFSDAQIPMKILATDIVGGEPYVFDSGPVAQAVRASTSLPLIFKPVNFRAKVLVDGGLSNPVPGNLAKEMGADIVISVNLYHKNEFIKQKFSTAQVVVRCGRIGLYNLAQMAVKDADIVITPDISIYAEKNGLEQYFDKKIADDIIEIGEKATDKLIPQIRKLLK